MGPPWLLPLLNALPAYAVMIVRLLRGDRGGAVRAALAWALTLAVCGTLTFTLWPHQARAVVIHGPEYQSEMFEWIRTGKGSEGTPSLFLPQHALHVAAFVALGLGTASAFSMLLGAVFVNSMGFYVASLATAGAPTWAVVFLGWQPWALCRVAAFCSLGVVLAEPLLFRVFGRPRAGGATKYVGWAAFGIAADCVLKVLCAPLWGIWLRGVLPAS